MRTFCIIMMHQQFIIHIQNFEIENIFGINAFKLPVNNTTSSLGNTFNFTAHLHW